ncbi:MAG TPA: radical SAM protein [Tenuifilaceae bacterium]|nr:radical SAM protein [Tenuifilaceae bacterium]
MGEEKSGGKGQLEYFKMVQIYRLLKVNRMIKSNRIKLLLIVMAQLTHKRYYSVRIDPVFACNLRCRMCYFSKSRKPSSSKFTLEELKLLAKSIFSQALQVMVGCGAEPTMYKNFVKVVKLAKLHNVPHVGLVTNGQLLSGENISDLLNAELNELTISIHGTCKETYEYLMTGAKWDKIHLILNEFNKQRKRSGFKTSLRVNFTANADNYTELANFFDVFGKYGVNTLQVRPVMDIGGENYNAISPEIITKYYNVIDSLKAECKRNNVLLLANTQNPSYKKRNPLSSIIGETYKYVSPEMVIAKDFEWQKETYSQYLKRTKWAGKTLRKIFHSYKKQPVELAEKYSSQYDFF